MRHTTVAAIVLQLLGLPLIIAPQTSAAQTSAPQTAAPQAAPPQLNGTVSGHVFCADTNAPARFAHVSLEAISDPSRKPVPNVKPEVVSFAAMLPGNSVETNLDGSFTLTGVKPGNYYVIVEKDGYIKPRDMFNKKQLDDTSVEMRALVAAALPSVSVEGGHTEQAEVRLERGAAISGTLLYDDGSPASEIGIKLLHKDASGKWVAITSTHFSLGTSTDDRGYFRMASLLGDEYMVEADLVLSNNKAISTAPDPKGNITQFEMFNILFTLPFYGSGTARLSQATGFKLASGQELTGQDMTLPISKLHKLTGRVAAGGDGHLVNAAKVALLTRDDNKELATAEISRDDGLFHFEFIPVGDYVLHITDARDVVWETPLPGASPAATFMPFPQEDKERILATYGSVDQTLLFSGDTLGITVTIPPDAKPTTIPSSAIN